MHLRSHHPSLAGRNGGQSSEPLLRAGRRSPLRLSIAWLTPSLASTSPTFHPPAGHFAPATAALFSTLTKPLAEGGAGVSNDEAVRIILSERENYELAQEIVRKEGLDVDLVTAELAEGPSLLVASL